MKVIFINGESVMVSDEDFLWASGFNWNFNNARYATCWYNKRMIFMHIEIFRLANPEIKFELVDHIDRNKLNNQRNNLRKNTRSLNGFNRKNQCGISWNKQHQK